MGLFDWLFPKRQEPQGPAGVFKMLNGYTPKFTSYNGGMYESELVRAAVNTIAAHISKLHVETQGAARPSLQAKLRKGPNEFQTWSQFLYRAATILYCDNTLFVVPVHDEFGEISGVYTPLPKRCEVVEYNNVPFLRYEFSDGKKAAVELEYCGIMTRHQYGNDFFGETNKALRPTMELIHVQNQGIEEGVKAAATYRFMAKVNNFSKPDDLAKERQRFTTNNLAADMKNTGLLLWPNTYSEVQQIQNKPWVVDADQMKIIRESVFEYFGVSEEILQNKYNSDIWAAFYEGVVEPFALQFSEVMTKMLFTLREQAQGNAVMATSNRLQYMSNADKLAIVRDLLDRGIMSLNDAREIFNLPPVEGGDERIIRGEYYNATEKVNGGNTNE